MEHLSHLPSANRYQSNTILPAIMNRYLSSLSVLFLTLALIPGCGGGGAIEHIPGGPLVSGIPQEQCASGKAWTGLHEASPLHHPGENCTMCHLAAKKGPKYSVAGTVYNDWHARDNCFGVEGVTIQITDAAGKVLTLESNEAGSFFSEERLTYPVGAKIIYQGQERQMKARQWHSVCNACHTRTGASGAPGRITIPQNPTPQPW